MNLLVYFKLSSQNMTGLTIWFTGLPCSGKTTLARQVTHELGMMGKKVEHLDGDVVRNTLCNDLGFSDEDRIKNIERITFVAKLLTRNGVYVSCSFVSPTEGIRKFVRMEIGDVIIVHVKCPLEECERRDVKGMYAKARKGEIKEFTGVSAMYYDPIQPEIVVETDKQTILESTHIIMEYLRENEWI